MNGPLRTYVEGIPVVASPVAKAGVVYVIPGSPMLAAQAVVGTRPWTQQEKDAEVAVRIARTGLAEWVRYIGETPGPAPTDPLPEWSFDETIAVLREAWAR